MPKKDSENSRSTNWMLCKWLNRPRSDQDPPFFFLEVRIGMLIVSMLFNLVHLIYEATVKDISVVLAASRLFLTIFQLIDHWWFCKNWESFFIEKKMQAYIWFRMFISVLMFGMLFTVQKTFPPYANTARLKSDAVDWAAGLHVMIWYLWGKRWKFTWEDMSDERRIPAFVGAMFSTSLVYGLAFVYDFSITFQAARTSKITSSMTSEITAVIAYFLMGLAFHYLNILTNRSRQACRRILDESISASANGGNSSGRFAVSARGNSGRVHPPSLRTLLPTIRRRGSKLMINIRQTLYNRGQPIDNRIISSGQEPTSITADGAARMFGNNVEGEIMAVKNRMDEGEENGYIGSGSVRENIDLVSAFDGSSHMNSSNKSMTLSQPNGIGDVGSASASSNNDEFMVDGNRARVKPNFTPSTSHNGTRSSSTYMDNSSSGNNNGTTSNRPNGNSDIGSTSASSNNGEFGVEMNRAQVELTNSHPNSNAIGSHPNSNAIGSSAQPMSNITDRLMIDHGHVSIARRNSLETNLVNYETAHLLSDKIAVVFVQVTTLIYLTLTLTLTLIHPKPPLQPGDTVVYMYDGN